MSTEKLNSRNICKSVDLEINSREKQRYRGN